MQYLRFTGTKGRKEKEHQQQQPKIDKTNELTTTKESLSLSSSSLLASLHYLIQSLFKLPYPIKLVAIGTIIEIFSGGFDSWWHYNFGFDGLLSPPHLLLASVYGALIGTYKLLQNNRHSNNSKSALLKISFIVTIVVLIVVVKPS
jgi:hypothetical protein